MRKSSPGGFWWYQFPAILYALLIFIFSSIPQAVPPPLGIAYEDKWIHLLEYGVLGFILARALWNQQRWPAVKQNFFRWTLILGIAYGLSDEWHQYFVPGRFAEPLDALADAVGVLVGALLFSWYLRRHQSPPVRKDPHTRPQRQKIPSSTPEP